MNVFDVVSAARYSALAYSESTFYDARAGAHGLVSLSPELSVLAFRGTYSRYDWAVDLNWWPRWSDAYGGYVHSGFADALDSVWPEILEQLSKIKWYGPILVTGHSLGGALACLAAQRLVREARYLTSLVSCVTFGQPRVGDWRFARSYSAWLLRVVNYGDVVPWVPARAMPLLSAKPALYTHAGEAMMLRPDGCINRPPRLADLHRDWLYSWLPHRTPVTAIGDHLMNEYERRLLLAGYKLRQKAA